MKEEFLRFLNALIETAPDEILDRYLTDGVEEYIKILNEEQVKTRSEITENGKLVLSYVQSLSNPNIPFKARTLADGMGVNSRTVSGALRKLVEDGFFDKLGESPVLYTITEKGKNYIIEKE